MADNPRIEDLRRRLRKDPASIAFAQLAEEHRRAGDHEEAIRVCRAGLVQHPSYLSARVTLARALVDLGRLQEAGAEFASVLESAPDNVVALRALADIHQRTQETRYSREAQRPSEIPAHDPAPDSPGTSAEAPSPMSGSPAPIPELTDPVLAELEAWLEVISENRLARHR